MSAVDALGFGLGRTRWAMGRRAISRTSLLAMRTIHAFTSRAPQMRYRTDIDGLRAISVIAVILFHISPDHFPGGGLGVDVFFVISGFLIGKIVLDDVQGNRFSFTDFYMRRVRRIAPALLICLLVSNIGGWFLLYPGELQELAKSCLAALIGGSNFFFFLKSGYFAADSTWLPLLHTWTLAVEEQFYFVFPAVTIAVIRVLGARCLPWVLLAIGGLSFAVSQTQIASDPSAAFYLLPSRSFELLIGVLTNYAPQNRRLSLGSALAALGLVLITLSLALIDPKRGFPGIYALPPCLGTALVLASGVHDRTIVHRLLSLWPLQIVGLASYSLYLWHWPILVYYRAEYLMGKLRPIDAAIALSIIFIVGFASWGIERRFRKSSMSNRAVLRWCGMLLLLLILTQVAILAGRGFPSRIPSEALRAANFETTAAEFRLPKHHCNLHSGDRLVDYDQVNCLKTVTGKSNWLIVGDSHAAMLTAALADNFPRTNFQIAVAYGCDIDIVAQRNGRICNDLINFIFNDYLNRAKISGVVLTSRWELVNLPGLANLAHRLKRRGIKLLLIGPTPEFTISVPRLIAESIRREDPSLSREALDPRHVVLDDRLAGFAKAHKIPYVSALRTLCPPRRGCALASETGDLYYSDGTHFNDRGAVVAVRRLIAAEAGLMLLSE